jgi:hypothetical protein
MNEEKQEGTVRILGVRDEMNLGSLEYEAGLIWFRIQSSGSFSST